MVEQTIFGGTQFDELAYEPDFAAVKINFQSVVDFNQPVHGTSDTFGAAQHRFDAAHQFTGAEWLGDVIVRSQFQAAHTIIFLAFGGQHDHWNIGHFADGFQNFKAIQVRHHHIQQDKI